MGRTEPKWGSWGSKIQGYHAREVRQGGDHEIYEDLLGEEVRIHLEGGREVVGLLESFDGMGNLVLGNTTETLLERVEVWETEKDAQQIGTRWLGQVVIPGKAINAIIGTEGEEWIEDPFPHVPEAQLLGLQDYQENYQDCYRDDEDEFPPLP